MNNGKCRLLALADFFKKYTDEDTVYSATEICEYLSQKGIRAERKALYTDIDALRQAGMDIVCTTGPKRGFFLASCDFEEAEVRLMIDAVQAAKFITVKKTDALVSKITDLLSAKKAEKLKSQVYIDTTRKRRNEEIYYTIDTLNNAIISKKQVKFTYTNLFVSDGLTVEKSEREFTVNPYALIWSNDCYYLVCNNPGYNNLMHTRLDRMSQTQMLDIPAAHFSKFCEYKEQFDSADYASKLFNMFSGLRRRVVLRCSDKLLEVILERFGEGIEITASKNGYFDICVTAVISEGFVSWILQHAADIEVITPTDLRRTVGQRAALTAALYED